MEWGRERGPDLHFALPACPAKNAERRADELNLWLFYKKCINKIGNFCLLSDEFVLS